MSSELIERFFSFFAGPTTPWALAGGVVIAALLLWLRLRLIELRPVEKGLARIVEFVRRHGDAREFGAAFGAVDAAFSAEPYLAHSWREFTKTLLRAEGRQGVVQYTRRPQAFFDDRVVANAVNLRFYLAVPNYLVGVGLLFTFLGLVAALYFASHGVAAARIEAAQAALHDLLAAATFKFVTSIVGLGASIAFSWRLKHRLHLVSQSIVALCQSLEERLDYTSLELIGSKQLRSTNTLAARLERLPVELGAMIGGEIGKHITLRSEDFVLPVVDALKSMQGTLGRSNEATVARLVDTFASRLEAAAGAEIGGMVAGLQKVTQGLEVLLGNLALSGTRFGEGISDAVGQVKSSLVPLSSQAQDFATTFERMQGAMVHQLDGFKGALGEMTIVMKNIEQASNSLRRAGDPIERAAHSLDSVSGKLGEAASAIDRSHTQIRDVGRSLEEAVRQIHGAWSSYQQRFEGVDKDMSDAFAEMRTGLTAFRDQVQGFVRELDDSLARSTRLLSGAVQELADELDEYGSSRTAVKAH